MIGDSSRLSNSHRNCARLKPVMTDAEKTTVVSLFISYLIITPFFQGLRYRFRSVSNSIQNCPIEISVDNHTLLIISSDAHNIQPIEGTHFAELLKVFGRRTFINRFPSRLRRQIPPISGSFTGGTGVLCLSSNAENQRWE